MRKRDLHVELAKLEYRLGGKHVHAPCQCAPLSVQLDLVQDGLSDPVFVKQVVR